MLKAPYSRFEEYLRSWMKKIQELLLESEQLRLETDDAGPQVLNIFFLTQRTSKLKTAPSPSPLYEFPWGKQQRTT